MPLDIWGQGVHDGQNVLSAQRDHLRTWEEITRFQLAEYLCKESERRLMSKAGIPMLKYNKACPLVKYKVNP